MRYPFLRNYLGPPATRQSLLPLKARQIRVILQSCSPFSTFVPISICELWLLLSFAR